MKILKLQTVKIFLSVLILLSVLCDVALIIKYNNKPVEPDINIASLSQKKIIPETKFLTVSIVVPIYNALPDVKKCLESLQQANLDKSTEIILIDDYSDSETKNWLRQFTLSDKRFKLLRNSENKGFIYSSNKGFALAKGDIIVILNSDTQVPENFDGRIRACFASDKNIAIASPLATNSLHFQFQETAQYDFRQIDRQLQKISPKQYPLFTSEGFCFCVRRSLIKSTFLFDTVFGVGYCEEDDVVLRTLANGHKTVLIDNLLLYHKRQASFGSKRREEIFQRNYKIFRQRWGAAQDIVRRKMKMRVTIGNLTQSLNDSLKSTFVVE
jgi:GT2 family glycosyltransferase